MTFNVFFERMAFGAMTAVLFYSGLQLKEMATSVQTLNTSVAVLIEKGKLVAYSQQEIRLILKEHEQRLYEIEKR